MLIQGPTGSVLGSSVYRARPRRVVAAVSRSEPRQSRERTIAK